MRFPILIIFTIFFSINFLFLTKVNSKEPLITHKENYEAIVLGRIIKSEVKNRGKYYLTEYKLVIKEWLYKKSSVQESKYITIRVLGADLPGKKIIIKASTTPDYIPMNKDTIFLLEPLKKKEKGVFTITKNGILPESSLKELKEEM